MKTELFDPRPPLSCDPILGSKILHLTCGLFLSLPLCREAKNSVDVSPKPGRGSGDRPRDTVAVVWIGTKYTKTLGPTARRHTHTLRLGTAPQSPRVS